MKDTKSEERNGTTIITTTDGQLLKEKLKSLPPVIPQYINSTVNIKLDYAMFTSNFQNLAIKLASRHSKLMGPKGCGKTFLVVVMFCLCWLRNIPCLLLSPASFDFSDVSCRKFFKLFLDEHIKKEQQAELTGLMDKDPKQAWNLAINEVRKLIIFADLVTYTDPMLAAFIKILQQSTSSQDVNIILAVTSGAEHLTQNLSDNLHVIVDKCISSYNCVNIETGFTEREASTFVDMLKITTGDKKVIKLEDVVHITGTSPLLLSWLEGRPHGKDVNWFLRNYRSYVDAQLTHFLTKNSLKLVPQPTTTEEFFAYLEVIKGRQFAYAASSGDELTKAQLDEYYKTWLHKNLITVLESIQPTGKPNNNQKVVLRWNFPPMRTIYIKLLDEFIKNTTCEKVRDMCAKESSFLGFWYESEFFKYYNESRSISVEYITPKDGERS